jgi:hypothetical protein
MEGEDLALVLVKDRVLIRHDLDLPRLGLVGMTGGFGPHARMDR